MSSLGLNLTGGGARGSYQAGVLKALGEVLEAQKLVGEKNPFRYWSGVSAGAINQAYALSGLDNFPAATKKLVRIWASLEPHSVYKTDVWSLGKNSVRWIRDLSFGSSTQRKMAKSLLDTTPLFELLSKGVRFERIQKFLEAGLFDGAACQVYSYRDNRTVCYVQSLDEMRWNKPRRYSKASQLDVRHVMASCAIPILFPSVEIDGEYMADGSFRSTTPLSPLMHMGADKILFVGVRGPHEVNLRPYVGEPHLAKVAGLIMNALFFDTIDVDIERIEHLNELVRAARASEIQTSRSDYREIDIKILRPSRDIAEIAEERAKRGLPRAVNFLLAGLGSGPETAELASYILFESEFMKELIDLGYKDTISRKEELESWILG